VRLWAEVATRLGRELGFHTEVDTGMGRAGFPWREAAVWGAEVARLAEGRLRWSGCFTHFHSADEPDLEPTRRAVGALREALAALPETGQRRVIHCANSAATLRCAAFGTLLVRPGIHLYGGRAGPGTRTEAVVSVRSRLALVRTVEAGSTAGYGATYRAAGPERWGTVAIGYGDGIPRALSPGGRVLVRGRSVPIIGRISMDMVTVRLDDVAGRGAG
jgi:alanine racemase